MEISFTFFQKMFYCSMSCLWFRRCFKVGEKLKPGNKYLISNIIVCCKAGSVVVY